MQNKKILKECLLVVFGGRITSELILSKFKMANQEIVSQKLRKLSKRGWTLKPYRMWGFDKPCPPRLVVNTYKGCDFKHKYCYIESCAKPQKGFRNHLTKKINEAKRLGLEDVLVLVSSSTDPFQPIEKEQKDSLFALESLLSNGFPVLVMTRNPQMLLEKGYQQVIKNSKLYVDVSIPSNQENNSESIFYSAIAPPLTETFGAIRKLSDLGKKVRIKIEPIIPSINFLVGQTKEELNELVKNSKKAGAKKIISKTLRLNRGVPNFVYGRLIRYYKKNGFNEGRTLALREDIRRNLLKPIFEACKDYEIPFFPCVDSHVFEEKTACCLLDGK